MSIFLFLSLRPSDNHYARVARLTCTEVVIKSAHHSPSTPKLKYTPSRIASGRPSTQ